MAADKTADKAVENGEAAALRWSVERRLTFIERRLAWEGRINRADLVAQFGISPNQATADLRRFEVSHPGALIYDPRVRAYRAGPEIAAPTASEVGVLLRELRLIAEGVLPAAEGTLSDPPPLALAETPARHVDASVLSAVLRAIRDRRQIEAAYRSFSSAEVRRRVIEPHALVFDGFRWHTRARDVEVGDHKDFVLGRLADVVLALPVEADPAMGDLDWHTCVTLVVAPHPGLTEHQRAAIEIDYGMIDGRLELDCRRALVWYLRRRLGLVPGHERLAGTDQHIVLVEERVVGRV